MAQICYSRSWRRLAPMLALLFSITTLVAAQGQGPGAGGGGGGGGGGREDEGLGNNLSVPTVFSESFGVTGLPTSLDTGLRPRPGEPNETVVPFFDATSVYLLDGVPFYPQQTTSHWCAEWLNGLPGTPDAPGEYATVNWSDNLVKQKWTPRSTIRIETVLYQNPLNPLSAYGMQYLYGKGSTEMWGATGGVVPQTYRTLYSVNARLSIEKITGPGGIVVPDFQSFSGAVYQSFGVDGPGGYTAEVNVSGNLIYGYNWALRQWAGSDAEKAGWWRLTFSLDPEAAYTIAPEGGTPVPYNVPRNLGLSAIDVGDVGDEVYFEPTLVDAFTSVLEIEIVSNRKGGRKPVKPTPPSQRQVK